MLREIARYKVIKFLYDKHSKFIPIDIYLRVKKNLFTVRDFIYNEIQDKSRKQSKKVLIIISAINEVEKGIFLEEGNIIKEMFSTKGYEVELKVISSKLEFLREIRKRWLVIHYIGHTDMDKNGSFINVRGEKVYSVDIKEPKADFVFFNSCNSATISEKVSHSFPYKFLRNSSLTFIGNLLEVKSEYAKSFSKEFYTYLLEGDKIGEAFIKSINKFNRNKYVKTGYILYGDYLREI